MSLIPDRISNPEPVAKRFYVESNSQVYLALQQEAFARGVPFADFCGLLLADSLQRLHGAN